MSDQVSEAIADAVEDIQEAAAPVIEAVVESPVVEAIAESEIVESITEAAEPVVDAIVDSIEPVAEAVADVAEAVAPVVEVAAPVALAVVATQAPIAAAVAQVVVPVIVDAVTDDESTKTSTMAVPAKFGDLGKTAKDLLNKNYHLSVLKIEGKTASPTDGVEFTINGSHSPESGAVSGSVEGKVTKEMFNITEKWTTDNVINTVLSSDKLAKGLKADLDVTVGVASGKKSAILKTAYSREAFHGNLDVNLLDGPAVNASAVADIKGVLLGAQVGYDVAKKAVSGNSLALAYNGCGFGLTLGVVNLSKYCASLHHKINSGLTAAVDVGYSGGASTFAAGVQQSLDGDSFIKAKVNCDLNLGLSYVTKLRDGVQVTFSSLINGKDLNGGGHQVGLSLNLSS